MKDLFLTPRGDLAIENISDTKNRLELNFITSKSNALIIDFFIEDTIEKKRTPNSLLINFATQKPLNNKEIRTISDNMAIEQAIKIRLLSSLGSIEGNTDIGSKLELIIHNYIDKDNTLINLEKFIREAINDIIINPTIKINKINSKYLDYSNSLKVIIIDEDNNKYNITI